MKIGLHVQSTFKQMTGIGQYTTHLIQALADLDRENEYFLLSYIPWYNFKKRARGIRPAAKNFKRDIRWIPPHWVNPTKKLSLFHTSHFNWFPWVRCRMVFTVHDCSWRGYPAGFSEEVHHQMDKGMEEALRRADRLVAVSESTRKDILKYFPIEEKKIKVIYNAAGEIFHKLSDRENVKARLLDYGISFPYILFVGSFEPVKNVPGLLQAYQKIHHKIPHHLLLIGGLRQRREEVLSLCAELGLEKRVHLVGYVSKDDLVFFYNMADIFIYPSFYEGFGIPILEAFQCGTPVITSNTSAMREVAGDAALLIDPYDVESISEAMLELIRNRALREALAKKGLERARRFSWKNAASEMLALFKEVSA